ncbi:MAG: class I SAM-dependent methyltransferase [Planctomycetota bacterium]
MSDGSGAELEAVAAPRPCDLCGGTRHEPLLHKRGANYLLCADCGLIQSDLDVSAAGEENLDYFGDALDKYSRRHYAPKHQFRLSKRLRKFAPYRKLNRILEVGANVGGFVHRAREEGWEAVGVEPVAACCEVARERHGVELVCALLEEAGLPEASFDAVFTNAVFEHLPSPRVILAEIVRLLRPGGVVFIDTVNWDSYTRRNLGADWKLIDPSHHVVLFTPETLRRYCEDAGLEVVALDTRGVRFLPNESERPRGLAKLRDELRKAPLSLATRFNGKGDSVEILARKPERG